jgi:hypothetical protein
MQNLKAGDIYDKSKVLRVDKKAGLFLEIPSSTPSPGFISVCETLMNILLCISVDCCRAHMDSF